MKPLVPGHDYQLENGTLLAFRREADGPGVTTCELIDVLVHRIEALQLRNPCGENLDTLAHLLVAKAHQQNRAKRIAAERQVHSCAPSGKAVSAQPCTKQGNGL